MSGLSTENYMDVLDTIYDNVFKHLRSGMTDVFLCGGISTKSELSTRDKLKKELESNGKIRILYPEELFMDILNLNKGHDLLSLEKLLADNCDRICIVCESVGSFVELGAFTNNSSTFEKVIALVQTKYKNQQSFLMLGPIKYIQSKNKENVLFYNTNVTDSAQNLISLFKSKSQKITNNHKDIDTIVGMHYLVLLMLYFFREVDITTFIGLIKQLLANKRFEIDSAKFNLLFRPAIKLLYKERLVEQIKKNDQEFYTITPKGKLSAKRLISTVFIPNKYRLIDKIRLDIIKSVYY